MAKKQSPAALVSYWRGLKKAEKDQLAYRIDTSTGYLRQVFLYGKQVGSLTARQLGEETGLGAAAFRPDIFADLAA